MNRNEYQNALDQLTPDSGLKDRIEANLQAERRPVKAFPLRRGLSVALAAALVLACTVVGVLAVSPELRTLVLSFFHLEETEQVPEPAGPGLTQAEIGPVKAQYIALEGKRYSNGYGVLFQVDRSEEDAHILAVRFWTVADGELVALECQTTAIDLTWKGEAVRDTVYWCVTGDRAFCYCDGAGPGVASDTHWTARSIPGRTDAALLYVSQGRQLDFRQYPLLLHLDTGEVEDILAGTGVYELGSAAEFDWSADLSRVIINTNDGQATYLCDRDAGTLTELTVSGNFEEISAAFAGEDALLLSVPTWTEGTGYTATTRWAYDLTTGEMTQTLSEEPIYREEGPGAMFFGKRYCVRVREDRSVSVLDLLTGAETSVENFTLDELGNFASNPSGTKLLYYVRDAGLEGLGISQIGVLDLEQGAFTAFDREGYEALREVSLGWFDDERIVIHAISRNDGESHCFLVYEF